MQTDPTVHALVQRALDAATAAGAAYADVRLTRILQQSVDAHGLTDDGERLGVGVRALANGAWGFAAGPVWNPDAVVRLARSAAAQARANAKGVSQRVALAPAPVVSGAWATPVQVDPFTVPIEEKADFFAGNEGLGLHSYQGARAYRQGSSAFSVSTRTLFVREERVLGTSAGTYVTQTLYQTHGSFDLRVHDQPTGRVARAVARGLGSAAAGWEFFVDVQVAEQVPSMLADAEAQLVRPQKRGEIGRYDVVFDVASAAALVDATFGVATQLDRALGYEANAGGTSYLNDPLGMLGQLEVASKAVTITANRSAPAQLATVKWDDEGVIPEDFTLVKDGVLVDYQTTREQASWLKDYYAKAGQPVTSHGCAASPDALAVTMQHPPNLALRPGREDVSMDDLIKDTSRGLAVFGADVVTDFQARTGIGGGPGTVVREIVNGRLGATVAGLAFSFESNEIWKSIRALGGPGSVDRAAFSPTKGQPEQTTWHTVSAVPVKIANVAFLDPTRRA